MTAEDFHKEIAELAETARTELREKEELARARPPKKRLKVIVWVGAVLILAELGLLGAQIYLQREEAPVGTRRPNPLATRADCDGAKYRAYQAMIAYRRANGRWPATLGELVGSYVSELPADPATGRPLVYSSDGARFRLSCAP